jgi:hypothetical protein
MGGKSNETKINKESCLLGEQEGFTPKNVYSIGSTYCEWNIYTIEPSNLLRGLNNSFKEIGISFPDLDVEPKMFLKKNIDIIKKIKNKKHDFIDPRWHPLEYTKCTLNEICNTYNLMILLNLSKENLVPDLVNVFRSAKIMYYKIMKRFNCIFEENGLCRNATNAEIDCSEINSHFLNNAIAHGGLFIRKVKENSKIEEYTNSLFAQRYYVQENGTNLKRRNNLDDYNVKFDWEIIGEKNNEK